MTWLEKGMNVVELKHLRSEPLYAPVFNFRAPLVTKMFSMFSFAEKD
jgi:hypothetical protein